MCTLRCSRYEPEHRLPFAINYVVLHDCADWSRVLSSKRFCKHIGKLLLSLDKQKASNILKQIYAEKEAWEFKPYTE